MIRATLKYALCLAPLLGGLPAQAGVSLDGSFGNPMLDGVVNAIAVDANGRIVIGGNFTTVNGTSRHYLARLHADGTLDTSFADTNLDSTVNAVAIDSTGKIVAGGSFQVISVPQTISRDYLARFDVDGSLDTSFANPNLNNPVFGIAIDGSDKIVVVGEFDHSGGATVYGLARFDGNGALDMANDPAISGIPRAVAIDGTGKIVITGNFAQAGGQPRNNIARFNADGTLDMAYDPNPDNFVWSVAADSNGRILVGGDFTTIGGAPRTRLARLDTTGNLDTSFADPDVGGPVWAVKVLPSGKILIGGEFTTAGGQARSNLALYDSTGAIDPDFVPPTLGGGAPPILALQTDNAGRFIIGGNFTTVGGMPRTHAARMTMSVTLSVARVGAGVVTASVGGINCGATCSTTLDTGTGVTLTATADSGSSFAGWSGDCNGAVAATTFTLTANRNCTATFSALPPQPPSPTPPAQIAVPVDLSGSGQGTVSLAQALGNPGPGATFTVQQTSGAALPAWLSFNPATLSFSYDVPLPPDLPIQPAAAADLRATRAEIPNRVYPLSVLMQAVPVLLTLTSGGVSTSYVVNMNFHAPRSPVVMTAVSYGATGRSGDGASGRPALSWDGGQILFETAANNLFAATSAYTKIGRYHGLSGNRDLLSQTAIPGGGVANASNGPATAPAVSANGSWGAFAASGGGVTLTPGSTLKQVYRTSLGYPRIALNEAMTPPPTLVSATASGVPANAAADNPALSEDGGLVAFESAATNLGRDVPGVMQIWRQDAATRAILLVSSTADGTAGDGDSRNVSLSWDGRFAAFDSISTNLVAGASGRQVYLKDLQTGAIFVIAAGSNAKLDARADSIVFSNGGQVLRFDRATGRVTRIGAGDQPAVSADGRFVAWRSAGDPYTQVWVRDVFREQAALVSQTSSGTAGSGNSYDPAISGDGGTIGFGTQARDLVNGNPLAGQIHVAANPLLLPGRTDYWYVTAGGNQAWAIERWGSQGYIANLAYQPGGGVATWGAGLCRFEGLVCRGTLVQTGSPVVVRFDQGGAAASLTVAGGAVQPLAVYPILGTSTTGLAGLPQGGWWYEPAKAEQNNGVFLAFDTQVGTNGAVSQTAHLTLLTYDPAGLPLWYAAEGVLGADLSLEGTLMRYAGGAAIGTTGGSVAPSSSAIGTFRLSFAAGDRARLRLPDGRTAELSRFRF